jgi:hypothetical protein
MGNVYILLLGESEGKVALGTPRHIREDNIKTKFKEIEFCVNLSD